MSSKSSIRETDLYQPIKTFLEDQHYCVKSEIGSIDIVACRDDEPPVIVELKTGFSLALFHQAIERQSVTHAVYVAVARGKGKSFLKSLRNNLALCRRLGLGLLTVRLKDSFVEAHLDPAPYKPRQSPAKRARLLREFGRRVGDPNVGGSTRKPIMTAYRQDGLRCLQFLHENGPTKAALVAKATDVERARRLMADNHYGWFERTAVGIYTITPTGIDAITANASEIKVISEAKPR